MDKKLKIAIVGGALSARGGGASRSMAQQAAVLAEEGHSVSLFVGHSKKYPITLDQFNCDLCEVVTSRLWGPSVLGLFPIALCRLWKQAGEFDFIHLNGAWNLTTTIVSKIARIKKVPYIITMRGHFGEYHFRRLPLLKKFLFQTLEQNNIKHALAMHATAQWEVRTSKKALKSAKSIIIIPNPVDLSDFHYPPSREDARKRLDLHKDDFHVIHLGRLAKQKNLPFLVEAFAQANLGRNAFLTFIGPAESDLLKHLRQKIRELDLESQIRFIDFAKGVDRCDWLAAADLFALPSFDENFCIVAVESSASGTHCLLSPNVGAIEFLPDHLMTVRELNINAWTDALKTSYATRIPQQVPPAMAFQIFSKKQVGAEWNKFYKKTKETLHENS